MKKFELDIQCEGELSSIRICVDAPDAVSALEKTHKVAQKQYKIAPQGYKIIAIAHVYNAGTAGKDNDYVRSEYPVPGGPNPDTTAST